MEMISLNLQPETRTMLNNPAVPLNSQIGWELLSIGGNSADAAGELVSPQTAVTTATVNSCVQLLSQSIAGMPLRLSRQRGSGTIEATDNELHRILFLEPNEDCSAFTMWQAFVASMALWGAGYIEIQWDGLGNVLGLWFLRPDTVTPFRQIDGTLGFRCTQGMTAGQFRILSGTNVIYVPWFSSDGLTGQSPIQLVRNTVGSSIAMDRFTGRFFANYATPQIALVTKQKIRPEDKTKMRSDWETLQSGANVHRVAVLDNEMDLKILSVNNQDAQLLESRKFSREEICGLYGIKPSQIGSESRVAGETYAAQQLDFLTNTLGPILQKIRQELSRKLLRGLPEYTIRHDVSDRLKLDVKSQMDAFAVARQWGLMTANQCRKDLGLDPGGPECDTYWAPVNMIDGKRLLDPPTPTQTEGTENV